MEKQMKWTGNKLYLLIPLLAMTFMLSAVSVHASSDKSIAVQVPVKQVFTVTQGTAPQGGDVFSYELSPVTPGAPMPEGSRDGNYTFSLSGNQEALTGAATYTCVGNYEYRIGQTVGSRKEGYGYDERTYTLTVSVEEREGNLHAELILKNEAGEKTETAAFENTYTGKTTVVTKPGGTSPNYTTPTSQQRRPLVKTGDETKLFLLLALLIGSFLTLLLTGAVRKRKGNA